MLDPVSNNVAIRVSQSETSEAVSFRERILMNHNRWKKNVYYIATPFLGLFTGVVACSGVFYGKSDNEDVRKVAIVSGFIGLVGIGTVVSCLLGNKNNVGEFKKQVKFYSFTNVIGSILLSSFIFTIFEMFFYTKNDCESLCFEL